MENSQPLEAAAFRRARCRFPDRSQGRPMADREVGAAGCRRSGPMSMDRSTIAALREAFGPRSYYWRVNSAEDAWSDWLAFRAVEPDSSLRDYARLLVVHEVRRWGTAPGPLLRRLVVFLSGRGAR